jgi:cleavage and polyadenylation specificity factor subunit 3
MLRLKSKLLSLNTNKPAHLKTKVFSPANAEELRIPILMDKTAKVVGKLADRIKMPRAGTNGKSGDLDDDDEEYNPEDQIISGVLVQNDLKLSLMDPDDLREYAGLTTTVIMCRQKITLAAAGIELIRWALEGTFGGIVDLTAKAANGTNGTKKIKKEEEAADEDVDRREYRFLIMDTVTMIYRNQGEIEVEWEGNMMNDGIADAVMSVLLNVESSPAAVKRKHDELHCETFTNPERS